MQRQWKPIADDEAAPAAGVAADGLLRSAGLRATSQRVLLGAILFGDRDRHVTAESLYHEAMKANVPVSLATVYNTLNAFAEAGLLRQVPVGSQATYFDTNTSSHAHFFVEHANLLLDIPGAEIALHKMPAVPEGYELVGTEIVVRLKRKGR